MSALLFAYTPHEATESSTSVISVPEPLLAVAESFDRYQPEFPLQQRELFDQACRSKDTLPPKRMYLHVVIDGVAAIDTVVSPDDADATLVESLEGLFITVAEMIGVDGNPVEKAIAPLIGLYLTWPSDAQFTQALPSIAALLRQRLGENLCFVALAVARTDTRGSFTFVSDIITQCATPVTHH